MDIEKIKKEIEEMANKAYRMIEGDKALEAMKTYILLIELENKLDREGLLKELELVRRDCSVAEKNEMEAKETLHRFSRYSKADKENRLIELPCAIGDLVYTIRKKSDFHEDYFVMRLDSFKLEMLPEIGKTVFINREDAETVLEERRVAKLRGEL